MRNFAEFLADLSRCSERCAEQRYDASYPYMLGSLESLICELAGKLPDAPPNATKLIKHEISNGLDRAYEKSRRDRAGSA